MPDSLDPPTRSLAPAAAPTTTAPPAEGGAGTLPTTDRSGPVPTVPGYDILEELGRGGMGVVYRAVQTALNRPVALKVILAGGHASAAARARFLREAEAEAALDHPNVVRVYDVGQHAGLPYLALEFCPGGTLAAYARGRTLSPADAAALVEQVARGVGHAHARGVVHRDLKPENVLLTADGVPKVADFGLAKWVDDGTGLTASGAVMGTPAYMAPEQARGEARAVGPTADVWALGAILYRLLTGHPPFPATSPAEALSWLATELAVPPGKLNPQVPRPLDLVCLKCLAKAPADRYPTATELADDLRRHLAGEAVIARPPRRPIGRWGAVVAAVAVVLVGGLLAYPLLRSGRPDPVPAAVPAPGEAIAALAVLPFTTAGDDADTKFLASVVSDSVIHSLSGVKDVQVRSLYSVADFKGTPAEAGEKFRVQAVVTGRVTHHGDRVVVSAELIDVRHNAVLWGDQFDRPRAEVFALQEDVARQVSKALRVRFAPDAAPRRPPVPAAFELYQKGRYAFNSGPSEGQGRAALAAYRQAIDRDPDFALPHLATAEAYYWLSNVYAAPRDVIPPAKAAAARALELDDGLGEAHALLGLFAAVYDRDWPAADRALRRARELSPGSPTVHLYSGLTAVAQRRYEEALTEVRLAKDRDPSSSFLTAYTAFLLHVAGRDQEALEQLQSQVEVDAGNYLPKCYLGMVYDHLGRPEAAVAEYEAAAKLDDNTETRAQLGFVYTRAGRRAEAEAVLKDLLATKDRYVSPYNIAVLYFGLGDRDRAFEWFRRADEDHSEWMAFLAIDPRLEGLRTDPRFVDQLRRIGLAR